MSYGTVWSEERTLHYHNKIMYVYLLIPTISAIDIIDKIGKITTSYL